MSKEYDIFISYRREGGKEYARNLTTELVSRGYHPFLDFDELKDGKFDKRITDAIESAPVFMFILSPGCLDRCVNEDDWVSVNVKEHQGKRARKSILRQIWTAMCNVSIRI